MIFESHAHYDDEQFNEDQDQVLLEIKAAGISKLVNVASGVESAIKSVEMAKKYDFVYAAVGVHPHEAIKMHDQDIETLTLLSGHPKVVAIGEIGLDYYYDFSPKEVQKLWFREQLVLAKLVKLPVIIHSRDAAADTFDLIVESGIEKIGGVIHCFAGSKEMAIEYVKRGFYIGVGGVITFKNAKHIKEVVEAIPLESILIETDAPYLAPVPNRGKRNDSRNLPYIIEEIAKIKGVTVEEVIRVTYENGLRLFQMEA